MGLTVGPDNERCSYQLWFKNPAGFRQIPLTNFSHVQVADRITLIRFAAIDRRWNWREQPATVDFLPGSRLSIVDRSVSYTQYARFNAVIGREANDDVQIGTATIKVRENGILTDIFLPLRSGNYHGNLSWPSRVTPPLRTTAR
ncbi:hypothetical protein A2548_00300 [candidate division WOR-1 bacterium RIFOXYD2_FULL_41_8]|nr:MAG: hypothetical protein A2548_00300 [candidate division WOR-1 bacterium RIFOXYD2_FULL_41_8]